MDTRLTNNFDLKEFACNDSAKTDVPAKYVCNAQKVAKNLQVLRDYLKKPIYINSAYRTPAYNKAIGGATSSQHLTASAADIRVQGMSSKQVYDSILTLISLGKMHNGGVGLYRTFVHYDVRNLPARWDLR